jgi:ribosomal RNA-processing protein 8
MGFGSLQGFRKQTEGWPFQPVDAAIRWLKRQDAGLTVADFGCGDARLAASVPQAVHSLDLVAGAPGVIACNMAHTPLGACLPVLRLALHGPLTVSSQLHVD